MSSKKRSRRYEDEEDSRDHKRHKESKHDLEKLKKQTKKLQQEVQKIKHVETFMEFQDDTVVTRDSYLKWGHHHGCEKLTPYISITYLGQHCIAEIKKLLKTYEKPPPGLIKEDEYKPEDCIPDSPGNEQARDFLAHAPTKGLWMPLGKEVKVMQCWRCKRYGHRTGDKECPFFIKGNQKLEQFRVAHEDPMYDLIRENKRNEKETRIQQLQQLLQDTTSDSDSSSGRSSSSSGSSRRRSKKKGKKEKKKKEKKKQKKKSKKRKRKSSRASDGSSTD